MTRKRPAFDGDDAEPARWAEPAGASEAQMAARMNALLASVDAVLSLAEQVGAPAGWAGRFSDLRRTREAYP